MFCFSNAMSTVTPKVLKFKMIVVQPREADSSDMSDEDKKIKGQSDYFILLHFLIIK